MEVTRRSATGRERAPEDLRVRQMRARELLKGDLPDGELEEHVRTRLRLTTLEKTQN